MKSKVLNLTCNWTDEGCNTESIKIELSAEKIKEIEYAKKVLSLNPSFRYIGISGAGCLKEMYSDDVNDLADDETPEVDTYTGKVDGEEIKVFEHASYFSCEYKYGGGMAFEAEIEI